MRDRADAAGPDRRHLALVVEPAQGQHDAQKQSDRHEQRQLLQRREPDQPGDGRCAGKPALGRLAEHPRELVGQQHHSRTTVTATNVCATSRSR